MRPVFELVKRGQTVHFTHAHQGQLWYVTSEGVPFPVPVADIGDATFEATDKALLFLRYLRPHWEAQQGNVVQAPVPVAGGGQIRFTHYRQGQLWYTTEEGEAFPVPMNAAETALWPAQASATDPSFVSYLHAHQALVRQARHHQEQENVS
jgi:hypothetical protein